MDTVVRVINIILDTSLNRNCRTICSTGMHSSKYVASGQSNALIVFINQMRYIFMHMYSPIGKY